MLKKNPNYLADSEAGLKEAEAIRAQYTKRAQDLIEQALEPAANTIISISSSSTYEDVSAKRLQFDAAKHLLKLGGLEIDRREVSGGLSITDTHANRILDVAGDIITGDGGDA